MTQEEALKRLQEIKELLKSADLKMQALQNDLPVGCADARDHLQQMHYRLTDIKGHLGTVGFDVQKNMP